MSHQDVSLSFIEESSDGIIGFIIIPTAKSSEDTKKFCELFPYALAKRNARIWVFKNKITLYNKNSLSDAIELSINCDNEKIKNIKQILFGGKNSTVIFPLQTFSGFGIAIKGIIKNRTMINHTVH